MMQSCALLLLILAQLASRAAADIYLYGARHEVVSRHDSSSWSPAGLSHMSGGLCTCSMLVVADLMSGTMHICKSCLRTISSCL
jgi:hypothetical protein